MEGQIRMVGDIYQPTYQYLKVLEGDWEQANAQSINHWKAATVTNMNLESSVFFF